LFFTLDSMSTTLSQYRKDYQLSDILEVECLDDNLYRGQTIVRPFNQRVYGGQFLAQALNAASQTVKENFAVHSLHCYFIRPGDPSRSIIYQVDQDQDGKSFAKRSVRAIQRGKIAFHMIASFALCGYSKGYDVQIPIMPNVAPPEELQNIEQLSHKLLSNPKLPPTIRSYLRIAVKLPFPTDIRPLDQKLWFNREQDESGVIMAWMKVKNRLAEDQLHLHTCGLCYLSDLYSVSSILKPYPRDLVISLQRASIDHSAWIHRHFRSDDWLLGVFRTTVSHSGKGMSHMEFYQEGLLVATCVQEALARIDKRKPKSGKNNSLRGKM